MSGRTQLQRGTVIRRYGIAINLLLKNRTVTVKELQDAMGCSRDVAACYLRSVKECMDFFPIESEKIPRWNVGGFHLMYQISPKWKKEHNFIKEEERRPKYS